MGQGRLALPPQLARSHDAASKRESERWQLQPIDDAPKPGIAEPPPQAHRKFWTGGAIIWFCPGALATSPLESPTNILLQQPTPGVMIGGMAK